ncbi:MAG TPA: cupin domain-containing protein [Candidatus Binatia bacterium]|jgi:anti-sigma factor ChrR (cupin superfamily)
MVKHARPTEPLRERASLYALGALDGAARRELEEHIRDGCRVCGDEVAAFGDVAADLALMATPEAPPVALRGRLLDAVRAPESASPFFFLGADEGRWVEMLPGVMRKDLAATDAGSRAFLVRMAPGSAIVTHAHGPIEHCYLIEGDLRVAGRHVRAGAYHRAAAGSVHETIRTDGGALFLIVEARA